ARQFKGLPYLVGLDVLTNRPRDLVLGLLHAQDLGRSDIVLHERTLAGLHPPVKFADDVIYLRMSRLEMPEHGSFEVHVAVVERSRTMETRLDVAPMTVVFGQPTKSFERIEQKIFAPPVLHAFNSDDPLHKSDRFENAVAKCSACAKWNRRLDF